MAYHEYVNQSDLPGADTLAAGAAEALTPIDLTGQPISEDTLGAGDDTLTTINEALAPIETMAEYVFDTPAVEDAPVAAVEPLAPTTDPTLIPVDNSTATPAASALPRTDGTDYVE